MKLAPVLPLRKKSRARRGVEALVRLLRRKKQQPEAPTTRPPPRFARPGSVPSKPSARPSVIDAQAALMGDSDMPPACPPAKRKKKPKNPFLSTPVPETWRPAPEPLAPVAIPKPPKVPTLPVVDRATIVESARELPRFPDPPKLELPRAPADPREDVSASVNAVRATPAIPALRPRTAAPLGRTTAPVRAIAVAHENANAVGTVELTCTLGGLMLEFVRISAYTEGYVPYPTTSTERVVVPYEQVARVDVDGDGLVHLTVDPSCTPYSRLVLAGLVRDQQFDHVASHRRRARIENRLTVAALVAWVPVALLLRAFAPDLSAILVMGIAATVGGLIHALRRDIAARLVLFSRSTERVRDELLLELRQRLSPGRVRHMPTPSELPVPAVSPPAIGDSEGGEAGSLRGLFITAGIVGATAAAAILIGKNLLFSGPQPDAAWGKDQNEAWAWLDRDEPAAAVPPMSAAASIQPDSTPVVPPPPPCACERSDSPLWEGGIPRMSILSQNRPGPSSSERPSVYPEIAVVNNSSQDLKDIVMVVDFILSARDGAKARVVGKQDLFWEGKLTPGRAVKWRVRGRGDDFSVTSFISGAIGDDGVKAAPADAFYDLSLTANTPSVRLHGTKMLAYLGDKRVMEGLEKLRQEGREDMAEDVEQIALAAQSLRVCSVRSELDTNNPGKLIVKACVFNAGSAAQRPTVTAHAKLLDASNESRWQLPEDLPSNAGIITTGEVEVPRADESADPRTTMVRVTAER